MPLLCRQAPWAGSSVVDEDHWRERFFFAGIVSSSLAGIVLGLILGLAAPHDALRRVRRTARVLLRQEHPRWEILTQ